jgi:hypothetical protein
VLGCAGASALETSDPRPALKYNGYTHSHDTHASHPSPTQIEPASPDLSKILVPEAARTPGAPGPRDVLNGSCDSWLGLGPSPAMRDLADALTPSNIAREAPRKAGTDGSMWDRAFAKVGRFCLRGGRGRAARRAALSPLLQVFSPTC